MLKLSLLQSTPNLIIAIVVFILIIAFYLFGHSVRMKAIKRNPGQAKDLGAISGTLLGLLGLLLAFTFSMSNARFDARRSIRIDEANDIGTAILRTDIYPDSIRKMLRSNLKDYLEARIAFHQAGMDVEKMIQYYRNADSISKKVWLIAATYAKTDDVTTHTSQLIPALNAMIDVTTTSRAVGESTIPDSILYFLFLLSFCSSFLLGYDFKDKIDWVVVIGFAIILSATIYIIIDLDRPRSGLINMDKPNQKIVELREMFGDE